MRKLNCEYSATCRQKPADFLAASGCSEAAWVFPETTGVYQPIVIA